MSISMILVTGVQSGLGKHLHEALGGLGLTRFNRKLLIEDLKQKGVDVIIHCAFNPQSSVLGSDFNAYLDDNIFLLEDLLNIPHKKFIYISSIDVYPKNEILHHEDESIKVSDGLSLYGTFKLMGETIVASRSVNHLILRCSALLGKYSRPNTFIKLLKKDDCELSVSKDSIFNYVLCEDMISFLKLALTQDLKYVYNICSSSNVIISDLASVFNRQVKFGHFKYDAGNVDNRKAISVFPRFELSSYEVALEFSKII